MEKKPLNFPAPPKMIPSIAAGFETTANHIFLICLPVLLDLFLWLGPRLSLKKLLQPLIDGYSIPDTLTIEGLPDIALVQQAWSALLQDFNLLSFLRTLPVGVSSLMSAALPGVSPLGPALRFEVTSPLAVLGWLVLILPLGWLLGSLYFRWISRITLNQDDGKSFPFSLHIQSILLCFALLVLLFLLVPPLLTIVFILTLINSFLGQVAIFMAAIFSMWVILPVFFSPHGIYTYRQNIFSTFMSSLRLTRYTLPTSGWFMTVIGLIWIGLDMLWKLPLNDSWLTLVGIAGHAFISTALISASFIYYRDVNAWLQVVFEQLKNRKAAARG